MTQLILHLYSGTFFTDSSAADQKESDAIRQALRTKYKGQSIYAEPRIYGENDWAPSPVDRSMVKEILEDCKYSVAEIRAKLGRRKLYVAFYFILEE